MVTSGLVSCWEGIGTTTSCGMPLTRSSRALLKSIKIAVNGYPILYRKLCHVFVFIVNSGNKSSIKPLAKQRFLDQYRDESHSRHRSIAMPKIVKPYHEVLADNWRQGAHEFGKRAVVKHNRQFNEQRKVRNTAYQITQADPTNIVSVRRGCCRFCWGNNFEYQRTDWEIDRDLNRFIAANKRGQSFNPMGGGGYVKTRESNPSCPICLGEGESYTRVEDFRKLSHRDRQLIAGVKIGKNGAVEEIRFHNKIDAISIFAKMDGMIVERKVVKVVDMPEEELDKYFAENALTIDHNDPRLRQFAKLTNGTESTIKAESNESESTTAVESKHDESTTSYESMPIESTMSSESRIARLKRLRAEGEME